MDSSNYIHCLCLQVKPWEKLHKRIREGGGGGVGVGGLSGNLTELSTWKHEHLSEKVFGCFFFLAFYCRGKKWKTKRLWDEDNDTWRKAAVTKWDKSTVTTGLSYSFSFKESVNIRLKSSVFAPFAVGKYQSEFFCISVITDTTVMHLVVYL